MEYIIEMLGYYPVSLGHNCFPRMYIEKIYKKSYPRLPFDYLGSTMWGINDLIRDDFQGFASKENLTICPVYHSNSKLHIVNLRYMLIFLHDHKSKGFETSDIKLEKYIEVEKDYIRRIQRWKNLLASGSKLLFFRLGRNEEDRIHKAGKPEKESLEEFSKMMGLIDFRIIYFSYENPQGYDPVTKIIYVNIPKEEKVTDTLIQTLLSDLDTFKFVKGCL